MGDTVDYWHEPDSPGSIDEFEDISLYDFDGADDDFAFAQTLYKVHFRRKKVLMHCATVH